MFPILADTPVKGLIVVVRANFDVPLGDVDEKTGLRKITSVERIKAIRETSDYLQANGAKNVIWISHLGRPGGEYDAKLSLEPVALAAAEVLGVPFSFCKANEELGARVAKLGEGENLLLENLRFRPEEEAGDKEWVKLLLDTVRADLVVWDAFPVGLRGAHASVGAIMECGVPVVGGFDLVHEIESLSRVMADPKSTVAIISGAKVESKAPLIERFAKHGVTVLVGGLIAANGYKSSYSNVIVADDFIYDENGVVRGIDAKNLARFVDEIRGAKTIAMFGPISQIDGRLPLEAPTHLLLLEISRAKKRGAFVVTGGGDTGGYVAQLRARGEVIETSYDSNGGTAGLEFLEKGTIDAILSLEKAAEFSNAVISTWK